MTAEQIAALLAFAGRLDSRIRRVASDPEQSARTLDEWSTVLANVPAQTDTGWDAAHAVRRYYEQHGGDRSAQFRAIEPHHLLAMWAVRRTELMNRHTDPLPAADPDDPHAWKAELASTRAAVAAGRMQPEPYRTEVDAAGQRRMAALISGAADGVRLYVPENVARDITAYRPTRAAREAAIADGQPDPYTHKCTWCGAEPEQHCRTNYRRHGKGRGTRRTAHPCRVDAARRAAEHAEDEHNRYARLMTQPPAPREERAIRPSGGDPR